MSTHKNAKNDGTLTDQEIEELQDSVDMGDWATLRRLARR